MDIGQDDKSSVHVLNSTGYPRGRLMPITGALVQRFSFALALVLWSAFTVRPLSHIFGYSLGLWENYEVGKLIFNAFSFFSFFF